MENPRHLNGRRKLVRIPRPKLPVWLDWVITIALGIGVALLCRNFVAEPYLVPSGSMLETIHEGDRVLGEKVTFRFDAPKRGQVVTFQDPDSADTTLIKRVIATEGQVVDLVDGKVVVDGQTLDEPYTLGKPSEAIYRHSKVLSEPISYPFTVPAPHQLARLALLRPRARELDLVARRGHLLAPVRFRYTLVLAAAAGEKSVPSGTRPCSSRLTPSSRPALPALFQLCFEEKNGS